MQKEMETRMEAVERERSMEKERQEEAQPESGEQKQQTDETASQQQEPLDERRLAREQWLKRIPDDPGELLRRKFQYYYQRQNHEAPKQNPW